MQTNDVQYIKELYPRLRPDDAAIERYRDALDNLPPIVVARGRVLVDGFHRWQAHVREGRETIEVEDLGDLTDVEIFNESIQRNAEHGLQLSAADKRNLAPKLWANVVHLPVAERVEHVMGLLSVSKRAVEQWTKDTRQAEKDALKAKAWDLWLDCNEQQVIAEQIGVSEATISGWFKERKAAEIEPPESRQHFDVWQFHKADDDAGAQSYFGALPPQVVENLLWLYTEPGDIVVDLFAGSGTTIDVAKRMGRRVWASDIRGDNYSPHLPIHQHDATDGWPEDAPDSAALVILDPPYWTQAKGRYSSEPNEMSEMDLAGFYSAWQGILESVRGHTERVAYIISPTQNEDGSVTDHATDMLQWDARDAATRGSPCESNPWGVERRIIVTYQTQQATGQQVEWARENRRLLKLYRDLVVLR